MYIQYDNFGNANIARSCLIKGTLVVEIHMHQFTEIVVPFKGGIVITVNGVQRIISPGDVAIIPPFAIHDYIVKDCEYYIMLFPSNMALDFIQDDALYSNRADFVFRASNSLMEYIKEHYLDSRNKLYPLNDSTLYSLKALVYVIFEEYMRKVPVAQESETKKNILSSAILYMKDHFKEKITLEDVAAVLGYNPTYVSRCINRIQNMNFNKLLNSIRVEEAKKLLLQTNLRMVDIALECGFTGERSFYRAFSESAGCTPASFKSSRKTNKK